MSFDHNSVRKNLFLFLVHVSVGILDFLHVRRTKNLNLVEPLVMETRTLFRHFKVFRLHAILHDAAGPMRAHSGKGPV